MAFKRVLFQIHLWTGLILGIVFVLIGLSGSVAMLRPLFVAPPPVHARAADRPALDRGLAAARAALDVPPGAVTAITLPRTPGAPVRIHFRAPYGSGRQISVPDALTDPASGRLLATYMAPPPAFFSAIAGFHSHLLMTDGRLIEGWFGLAMVFLGLSGLYLWWPRRGQWMRGFIVRRKARGLRFHRELHGAAGIWTLAIFLLVSVTGTGICFPVLNRTVIAFLTQGHGPAPRLAQRAPIVAAPPGAARIGPDEALAAAMPAAGGRPVISVEIPETPDQAISVTAGLPGDLPIYVDPYRGTVVASQMPPPTRIDNIQRAMGRLHEAIGLGWVYWLAVFVSGLTPLIFFVTGAAMWWKKRQNRLAMNRPLPDDMI